MRALRLRIFSKFTYLLWFAIFLSKRAGEDGAQSELINDSEPSECKPQKPESPGKIHVQENAKVLQLQSTEISVTAEDPIRVNETASGVVQPTRLTEPVAENLLRSSKVEVSRRESDFEPPSCNCPGIYIFFLTCILIQMHESSRREYLTATEIGHELIWLISYFLMPRTFPFSFRLLSIA